MSWYYNNEILTDIPDEVIGFVYCITNLLTNKKYIGKKLFHFSKTKYRVVTQKNGTKKRKKIKSQIESDWQTYYGSSKELQADVEQQGAENFRRDILYLCKSKAEASYLEVYEQVKRGVLETDEYYNGIINVRIGASKQLKETLTEMRKQGKLNLD